jgi:mRNA interferase MazF
VPRQRVIRSLAILTLLPNGPVKLIARHLTVTSAKFNPGDIVWVPFPFVEAPRVRERPALVVASHFPTDGIELLWVLMITSAANKGWQGDISLEERYAECGLRVPCVIRTVKIATVEADRARVEGALPADLLAAVRGECESRLHRSLG